MRHVTGFFLALVMAAVLYGAAGWGTERLDVLRAHGTSLLSLHGGLALAALVGTGLLLGVVLVAPAVSPLAAVLPGLGLLAWSAYLAVSPGPARRLIPLSASHAAELGFRTLLSSGILALIGAVMIIPLFVPSRWRRRGRRFDDRFDDDDGYGRPDDGFGRSSAGGLLQ
jgi:hypothetical protein